MSATWCAAHSAALRYLRGGGASTTANCGYGHGFSVLEVIDTVKRVSGVDFPVELAPRRPGDPARIVAASDRARALLGWQPRLDDLATIVTRRARLGARARRAAGPQDNAFGRLGLTPTRARADRLAPHKLRAAPSRRGFRLKTRASPGMEPGWRTQRARE